MAAGNTSYSTLITTTLQNLAPEIFDNVIANNALLSVLKKSGNIKIRSGGRSFTHALMFRENDTFQARGKLDPIDLTVQDNISRAEYAIKILDGSIAIPDLDLAMNAGDKEKLIDLTEEKKMECETTMANLLGRQLFNTSVGANDFDSIPRLISTTPSSDTDVGGIDSSASGQTYWRNYTNTTGTAAFNTSLAGISAMNTALINTVKGRQGPRIIVTTPAVFTLYQLALTTNARYTSMETGDAGFRTLEFTTLPVYFDDNCPTGRMYFIDTDALMLQVLAQGNFKNTPFEMSRNQLLQSSLYYLYANITCGSRRTQGQISNITG